MYGLAKQWLKGKHNFLWESEGYKYPGLKDPFCMAWAQLLRVMGQCWEKIHFQMSVIEFVHIHVKKKKTNKEIIPSNTKSMWKWQEWLQFFCYLTLPIKSPCVSQQRTQLQHGAPLSWGTQLPTAPEMWIEVSSQGGKWELWLYVEVVDVDWKWTGLKNCPQMGVTNHSIFLGCRPGGLDWWERKGQQSHYG